MTDANQPFKNSTTRMLVDMAKGFFAVEGLSVKNKALIHATILYTKSTQIHTEVEESSGDLLESKQVMGSILGKLKDIGTNIATQNFKLYTDQSTPVIKGIDEIELNRDAIKTNFNELTNTIFTNIKTLLERVSKSPDIDAALKDQVMQNILNSAIQSIASQETELTNLNKNTAKYKQMIDRIIASAFTALPHGQQLEVAPILPKAVVDQNANLSKRAKGG